ncbi:intracellular coagulation inhibitor 3-like [Amblyomma americanum]
MTSGNPEMPPTDTESAVSLTLEEGDEERHVYWLLVGLSFGCGGSTKQQLEEVLRFSELPMSTDRIEGFFKNLIRMLRAGGEHQRLQRISVLFVASSDSVNEDFSKTVRENFSVAIRTPLADQKPEHTSNETNRWFEITSRGYLLSVISDNLPRVNGAGTSSCQLIASAAYAEHAWGSRFDPHRTILANFYNNGTNPCKTHKCLVVPSMARNWHMLLLLPTDRRGVHAVEYRLDAEAFKQAVRSCREALVELSMPNIELESSVCLSEVLKRAGLTDL